MAWKYCTVATNTHTAAKRITAVEVKVKWRRRMDRPLQHRKHRLQVEHPTGLQFAEPQINDAPNLTSVFIKYAGRKPHIVQWRPSDVTKTPVHKVLDIVTQLGFCPFSLLRSGSEGV
jgi:hypothetical protein